MSEPGFDVAIGMTQAELDAIGASLYQKLYPTLFTGAQTVPFHGTSFTVAWDIGAPASFDLSNPSTAREELRAHLATLSDPHEATPSSELLELAASSAAAFSFSYPKVVLKFTAPGVPEASITVALTASARIDVAPDGTQSIEVYALSSPALPDPMENELLQKAVIPQVLASTKQVFGGLKIPAIELLGLTLGPPVPFVQSSTLIAIASLSSAGVPAAPAPGTFTWPGSPFFTLLSGRALQALTAGYIAGARNSMSQSGSHGNHWGGDHWSCSLSIDDPKTSIQPTGTVSLSADVQGSVSASIYVVYVPIGAGFHAFTKPELKATLGLQVEGEKLVVKTRSVAPFEILLAPSGSISEKITAAMMEPIAESVSAVFSPLVSSFLGNIHFASFTVPAYSLSVSGVNITATPTGLAVGNVGGMLALTGSIAIST